MISRNATYKYNKAMYITISVWPRQEVQNMKTYASTISSNEIPVE